MNSSAKKIPLVTHFPTISENPSPSRRIGLLIWGREGEGKKWMLQLKAKQFKVSKYLLVLDVTPIPRLTDTPVGKHSWCAAPYPKVPILIQGFFLVTLYPSPFPLPPSPSLSEGFFFWVTL